MGKLFIICIKILKKYGKPMEPAICPRVDPGARVAGAVSQGAGAERRVHLPRDIGKRNAEKRATGACDLDGSLTTTGGSCLHSLDARSPNLTFVLDRSKTCGGLQPELVRNNASSFSIQVTCLITS